GFKREDVDAFAVSSHVKAAAATTAGRFSRSLIPVRDASGATVLERDELIRPDASREAMAKLKPLVDATKAGRFFDLLRKLRPEVGTVESVHHAGNAPGVVDGASLAVLASEKGV